MGHHEDFAEPSPIRGLPGPLPEGERLLWQGSPRWWGLAVRAYHIRLVAIYFGCLFLWEIAAPMNDGVGFTDAFGAALPLLLPAAAVLFLICLYAWFTARGTIYTLTSRRLALHFGLVVPRTINLPFAAVEGASVRFYRDGSGDIPVQVGTGVRLAYLQLWPNARPWHARRTQPMMRSLPDAADVAHRLAEALEAFRAAQAGSTGSEEAGPVSGMDIGAAGAGRAA